MASLLIAEELFLLTHDDESGKGSATMGLDNGYAGALLLDLAASGLIDADDELVGPAAEPASGARPHPLLEAALAELRASSERRKAKHWVNKLPGALKPIGAQVGASLVERGVLSEERSKVLGLFPKTTWPEVDPEPERELRERLRAVLVKGAEPDLRTGLLISLLSPLDLVKTVVDKPDRKEAKERAKTIAESDLGGAATSKAVKQAVDAITTAIVFAAIIPATVATST